jgi:threonine/homoserine/homoserine lactone efflux protein
VALGSIGAFWAVSLVLIAVPGADWAFTLGAGLRGRSIGPAVAGLALGYAGVTAVVAAGVGALVARSPAALTALTVIGGLYLVGHGVSTVARPSEPGPVPGPASSPPSSPVPGVTAVPGRGPSPRTDWGILGQGVAVSGLNPKGLLILLALLPQFTDRQGAWPPGVQIAVLGLVFTLTCAVFYAGLGVFARTVLRARPGAARMLSRCSGAAMVVIGGVLLAEHLISLNT